MNDQFVMNNENETIESPKINGNSLSYNYNGKSYRLEILSQQDGKFLIDFNGKRSILNAHADSELLYLMNDRLEALISKPSYSDQDSSEDASLLSPMPGKVFKVLCEKGQEVKKGDDLLVLEAMKMEHSIKAPYDGKVLNICFSEGEMVDGQVNLIELEAIE